MKNRTKRSVCKYCGGRIQDLDHRPIPELLEDHEKACKKFYTLSGWKTSDLFGADPKCKHEVVCAPGGGVKCIKCSGWFCY